MRLAQPSTRTAARPRLALVCLSLTVLTVVCRSALGAVPAEQPSEPLQGSSGELPQEPETRAAPAPEMVERSFQGLNQQLFGIESQGPPEIFGPRDLFDLQGIDQSHFDQLSDGTPWEEGENETLLKVMYRLHRSFPLKDVEAWCRGEPQPAELANDPDAFRGQIFHLLGKIDSPDVLRPVPEVAQRFELEEYYRCRFLLGEDQEPAVLFARTIPEQWKTQEPIEARAGAFAVFLKLAGDDPQQPLPVFVASRVAWYPPTRLGDLGFDWGLFDDLAPGKRAADGEGTSDSRPRRSPRDLQLTARNRECFYQMMAAAGRTAPGELLAEATRDLRRKGEERFSVVPLFNEPNEQHGRLVVLSGTVRQVIPIRVGDEDVRARFGIDRYYQVFLFTEDSQSNPLLFCVRELPEGMPLGEGFQFAEQVRVAGFFFNTWAYRSRRTTGASTEREEWQLAPLLIGRDLQWNRREKPASNPYLGVIAGGLFVAALFGIWLALWRYGRSDKQFHDRTIAKHLAAEPGISLDRIGLDADGAPDFSALERAADAEPGAPERSSDDEGS